METTGASTSSSAVSAHDTTANTPAGFVLESVTMILIFLRKVQIWVKTTDRPC